MHYALTHGQPVNSVLEGLLPLHAAASNGSEIVVTRLIDAGADVNAPVSPPPVCSFPASLPLN